MIYVPLWGGCRLTLTVVIEGDDGAVTPVPEFIDPVFEKTSPKRSFSMTENDCCGVVFTKTGSMNSGSGLLGGS
jgi:hypothetical protein